MKKRHNEIRDKLIGLGEDSLRKSYYPELQRKLAEIEDSKKKILEGFNEKREFMRNVLHELRTPIHGVNSLIHLLQGTELTEKQQNIIKDMVTSLSRLENLVGEIQNLANSGVFGTDAYVPLKLNDLLENVVSPILSRNCVQYNSFDEGEKIEGQIVAKQNELSNGLKGLCEYGSAYAEDCEVSFLVNKIIETDTEVELVFELSIIGRFIDTAQIDRFYSQIISSDQTGNAYQNSNSMILAFGGHYEVVVGQQGTTYKYSSKFERYAPAINIRQIIATKNKKSSGAPDKILVVEDNEINRNAMEMLLEDYNCTIDMATNGKEGVDAFSSDEYKLIFMDIKMPVMNGEEAIAAIREYEDSHGGHTPIIAMTAYAMSGDRERFMSIGADEYLAKPFDYDIFEAMVDRYISSKEEEAS